MFSVLTVSVHYDVYKCKCIIMVHLVQESIDHSRLFKDK